MNWNLTKITTMAIIVAAIGIGFYYITSEKSEGEMSTNPIQTQQSVSATPQAQVTFAPDAKFKDGTYTAEGDYFSPGGNEAINVQLTIKNNVITDSQVTAMAARPQSMRYQNMFIGGYKQYVVGKNISEVNLDKVSGSSLTPQGFNDAINKIKSQAQV